MLGITIGSHQSSPDIIYKDLAFFRTQKKPQKKPQILKHLLKCRSVFLYFKDQPSSSH